MLLQIALRGVFMAISEVASHLSRRGDLLLSGQIDTLLATYAFPLPVFLEERLLLVRTPDHARVILDHLRRSLTRQGIAAMRPKVTAVELPRAGRYRVWVDWTEVGARFGQDRVSSVIYYCRDTDGGTQIEMVNYTCLADPALNRQIQALALTA
jgi:hypothetical protein